MRGVIRTFEIIVRASISFSRMRGGGDPTGL
nr:MAG TPA: hypothetical protein [Caudoviricetes sp.]